MWGKNVICHLTLCKAVLKTFKKSEIGVVLTVCGAGREERKSEGRSGRELCHLSPNLQTTLWTERALREQTQRETTAHQHYCQAPDKTGKKKEDFPLCLMFAPLAWTRGPVLTFIPLCWLAVQPVQQRTCPFRYLVLRRRLWLMQHLVCPPALT